MSNKYEKLAKNTSIFALGTFGSKILVFLIVPLYTYVLTTTDYGTIDLITSTVNLLIPFTTLLIYEASIRFLVGKEYDSGTIFNNCIFIFAISCIFSICFSPILLYLLKMSKYSIIFIFLLILTTYTTIFGQYLRAIGNNLAFSISGIITTLFTVLFNVLFLVFFKMGIFGYLYSLLISQIITGIYIFIKCDTIDNFDVKLIDISSLKNMLIYCIPLVPNNIMWWIMNAGDKYVINYYLGTSANGIFSISYKIPTILTMLFSIFMQAWQVSAIEERIDEKRNNFYTDVFNFIALMMFICSSFIILLVKPLFLSFIGNDFLDSWKYIPILCVATLFNCFSTFAGVTYIVSKNSKKSFYTTFIGAICNLILNFALIQYIGLFGVAIGTALGYFVVMLLRFKDFKHNFACSLFDYKLVFLIIIIIIESICYIVIDGFIKYIIAIICILLIVIISKKEFLILFNVINKKILSKFKKM